MSENASKCASKPTIEEMLYRLDEMWSRYIQFGDHYESHYRQYKAIRNLIKRSEDSLIEDSAPNSGLKPKPGTLEYEKPYAVDAVTRAVDNMKPKPESVEGEGGMDLIGELDNLYRGAHDGLHPDDKEFKCHIEDCQSGAIYRALKNAIQSRPKVSREWLGELVANLPIKIKLSEVDGLLQYFRARLDELGMEVGE